MSLNILIKTGGVNIRRLKAAALIASCLAFVAVIVFGSGDEIAAGDPEVSIYTESTETATQSFSRFQHSNPTHNRMPCLLCHKREDNSAALKLPVHISCAGCHAQQFADSGSQICSICHTNSQTGATKRFPGLKSFNAKFDHARHLRQTNCATCHRPSRRGVALSVPSGSSAHSSCFQCHGPRTEAAGRNIGSCGTCHSPGRPQRNSDWAPAFAKNFSHSEHRGTASLNCGSCHTVRAGMPRGRQVSAPVASMHFAGGRPQSCATCHNNKRAFGGNDFSDCKRCHQGATFKF